MKFSLCLWVVSTCLAYTAAGQARPVLSFCDDRFYVMLPKTDADVVASLIANDHWKELLRIYTLEAFQKKIGQPIAGNHSWKGDTITFVPSFDFTPGESYYAVFDSQAFLTLIKGKNPSPAGNTIELCFSIPEEKSPPTMIESIHPESSVLPENLLRMYIYFSASMMPGEAYDHIKLLREDGTVVEKAFLIVDQELWDAERKRFTLLFDPGRIKRNLRSNLDLGAPLKEGEKYHLVIDSAWRDVRGHFLDRSVIKSFHVTKAERRKLSMKHWNVTPPAEGTLQDLVIPFPQTMDHFLVGKYIDVINSEGRLTGKLHSVSDTVWKFTPDQPWKSGKHVISFSPLMEDVAGNNFNNVFDIDLSMDRRIISEEQVNVEFVIGSLSH